MMQVGLLAAAAARPAVAVGRWGGVFTEQRGVRSRRSDQF